MPRTLAEHWHWLEPHSRLHLPDADTHGPGPFPAIVLIHSCGGLGAIMGDYAKLFAKAGFAALIADSFSPRKISTGRAYATVCTGLTLQGAERAGDAAAALWAVKQRAEVDSGRLGTMGWSHGGWTLMDLMSFDFKKRWPKNLQPEEGDPLAGLKGVAAVYPYCGVASRTWRKGWARPCPVLGLVTTKDKVCSPKRQLAAFERLHREGQEVELHRFDNDHAFDQRCRPWYSPFPYDPGAHARAGDLATDFFRRVLA